MREVTRHEHGCIWHACKLAWLWPISLASPVENTWLHMKKGSFLIIQTWASCYLYEVVKIYLAATSALSSVTAQPLWRWPTGMTSNSACTSTVVRTCKNVNKYSVLIIHILSVAIFLLQIQTSILTHHHNHRSQHSRSFKSTKVSKASRPQIIHHGIHSKVSLETL